MLLANFKISIVRINCLAIHRIRQYGTGEPEETVGEMVDALIIEDFEEDLESEDLN